MMKDEKTRPLMRDQLQWHELKEKMIGPPINLEHIKEAKRQAYQEGRDFEGSHPLVCLLIYQKLVEENFNHLLKPLEAVADPKELEKLGKALEMFATEFRHLLGTCVSMDILLKSEDFSKGFLYGIYEKYILNRTFEPFFRLSRSAFEYNEIYKVICKFFANAVRHSPSDSLNIEKLIKIIPSSIDVSLMKLLMDKGPFFNEDLKSNGYRMKSERLVEIFCTLFDSDKKEQKMGRSIKASDESDDERDERKMGVCLQQAPTECHEQAEAPRLESFLISHQPTSLFYALMLQALTSYIPPTVSEFSLLSQDSQGVEDGYSSGRPRIYENRSSSVFREQSRKKSCPEIAKSYCPIL